MKEVIFKQNANKKLSCYAFSHITPNVGLYQKGDTVHVKLDISTQSENIVFSYGPCCVENVRTFALHELTEEMARLECAMSKSDTMKDISNMYPGVIIYDYIILVKQKNGKEQNAKPQPKPTNRNPDGTVSDQRTAVQGEG